MDESKGDSAKLWLIVNEDNDRDLLHAKLLHDCGIDPHRICIDRAREKGI